jgi:putative tricarboxylic transport membrane protein
MSRYHRIKELLMSVELVFIAAALVVTGVKVAHAEDWVPKKNIEIVVPFAAGGGNDIPARIIQSLMTKNRMLPVSSTVVNKPGGGGAIGLNYLNQHAGDGHYLSVISTSMLTSYITGSSSINYTDITPIVPLITEYVIFAVNADSKIMNFQDLSKIMKDDPSSLSFAVGGGLGNPNHAAIATALKAANVDVRKMKAVAFGGGGQAMTALLGGHVNVLAAGATALVSQAKSGKLRFIAVAAPKRLKGDFSTVPTLKEQGTNLVLGFSRYIVGPKGLSKEQTSFWSRKFSELMKSAEWQTEAEKQNWESDYLNSSDTEKELKSNYESLRAILGDLGMAK